MELNVDEAWVNYSELDKTKYTSLLTVFSIVTSLFTHPLNVLTTRQQAGSKVTGDTSPSTHTVQAALKHSVHNLGVSGLFRGWIPVALMGLPSQVLYLSITESSRELLQSKLFNRFPDASPAIVDAAQVATSSVLANAVSLIPYMPADVLSCRLIVQSRQGMGAVALSKKIWTENGLRGFYRGFNTSLIVGVMFSAQWWWSYSVLRREGVKIDYFSGKPILLDATSGLLAGVFSTCTLHPLDTIKTRIMTSTSSDPHASSIIRVARDIVKTEGPRALWRGLRASMYQTLLSSTGFAIAYELIKRSSMAVDSAEE